MWKEMFYTSDVDAWEIAEIMANRVINQMKVLSALLTSTSLLTSYPAKSCLLEFLIERPRY